MGKTFKAIKSRLSSIGYGHDRAAREPSPNTSEPAQIQNAMRDARMQTYSAASASGGFANIDLNPRRPTTNRMVTRITNARNRYRTKGATRMPPRSISLGAFIGFTQVGS